MWRVRSAFLLAFGALFATFDLSPLSAQTPRAGQLTALVSARTRGAALPVFRPFVPSTCDARTASLVPSAAAFTLDTTVLHALLNASPTACRLLLSLPSGELSLDLVASRAFTDEFEVIAASTGRAVAQREGIHFVGCVNGAPNSLVALSIFAHEVMGLINDGRADHVLGPLEGSATHLYYAANDLRTHFDFSCGTDEHPQALAHDHANGDDADRSVHCVRFYWEVNNDVYVAKGGMTNTVNYATALFNQCAALYLNDGLSITLNQLFVWDVASPFTGTTIYEQLTYFQNTRNVFNGDLATLLGLAGGGGRAATLAGLCNGNNDNSMCYAGIQTFYSNIPTYSWSVFVVAHEQGHLLGSNHTHACAWNGNNTQIDGCGPTAGYSEGNCAVGPIPANGGTLMSYCHLNAVGINFSLGFGPQPLAVISGSVNNASCLVNCTATNCGPVFTAPTSNITATSAQLNWMPITNANSYKLQWKAASASTWNTVQGIAATSYALSGLSPWTKYVFQVKTNCWTDTSAYCPTLGFTTAANSLSDGLVACYPFNNSPNDQSGNGHHGTLFGPTPTADRYGVPNAAYSFNGVSDRIDVVDLNTFPLSNEVTVSFWVKCMESKGNAVLWAWPDIGADRFLVNPNFLQTGANNLSWDFGNHNAGGNCYLSDQAFHAEWQHYAFTSSATSSSMKMYLNGMLVDEEHHASALSNLNRTLCIGGNGVPIYFLHGALDDLTIHNRELTAGEVLKLYTTGTPCAQRVQVSLKVLLEGPYDQASQLMNDALRGAGLVPSNEPYTGSGYAFVGGGSGVLLSSGITGITGNNAVCDWVVVELRQPAAPYAVLDTRTALVQRDGDVVNFDGVSPVIFDAAPGNYHIAVRHRDHLSIMTGQPVALTANTTSVDFTNPATTTYGTNAQKTIGGRTVMWAGDTGGDGTLKYTGPGNDRDPILTAIGGNTPNNAVSNVYDRRDVNLDGVIKYTGANNDRDPILTNVGSATPNATRTQQLP